MTRTRSPRSLYRSARIEPLEARQLLSITPTLATIEDVTLHAGAPLYIALDGFDADGDSLTYSVSSSNSSISGSVLSGNRSMRIVVEGYGDMVFELFEQRAPNTTASIIDLIESDFYDGLTFHRIAEYSDSTPFVIQGGDPDGDGTGGPSSQFDDEFHPELLHTSSGILSMAKSSDDTNGSQFFITGTDTRHLDFNHSVFGILTEGEAVRQAIQNAEVDSNDKPLTDIVMSSVSVFTDEENGALMLTAPEGFTGEADITVTVDDGNGGTMQQTFHVTVAADETDSSPYLEAFDPPEVIAGESVTFQLPGYDAEGDDIYYYGMVYPSSDDITLDIDENGLATVTATEGASGVYSLFVGVSKYNLGSDSNAFGSYTTYMDTQRVPVYVAPQAPSEVVLLSSSDTGISDEDGLTNLESELWFRVYGVVADAEVSIFCDGTMIGQGMATSDGSLVVVSDTDIDLSEGTRQITARQVLRSQEVHVGNTNEAVDLFSEISDPLEINIDLTAPTITSTPPSVAGVGVLFEYQVTLGTQETDARYQLLNSPAGMTIGNKTGLISWTPTTSAGTSESISYKVTDAAGNTETHIFTLNIKQPPIFSAIGNQTVAEGDLIEFTVEAAPQNGNTVVVYSLGQTAPAGATIAPDTGKVSWTPTEAQGPDNHPIVIYAADSDGVKNSMTVWVNVTEVNVAPTLDPIDDMTINEGETLSFTIPANDPDLPANELTYTLIGNAPEGLSLDANTGQLTWNPNEDQGGQAFNLTVRVTDAAGEMDETSFTVTVREVDDAPVFHAQETLQYAYPGTTFSAKFHAFDPDVPTRSIEYSFEGDIPAGMLLNTTTGQVTWEVPEGALFDQKAITVRASEILGDGSLGLSSIQTIQVVIGQPWIAALEQAMQQVKKRESSSPEIDAAVLAAALSGTAPTAAGTTPQASSSAKGSLSSGTSDFAAEEGFFGLQLGTSIASGSEVKPMETDPNELPGLDASKKRDEKVVPASATEDVSHHTHRADQNTEAAAAVDSQELYYDMTNDQPTLQSTAQATPEETPEQG